MDSLLKGRPAALCAQVRLGGDERHVDARDANQLRHMRIVRAAGNFPARARFGAARVGVRVGLLAVCGDAQAEELRLGVRVEIRDPSRAALLHHRREQLVVLGHDVAEIRIVAHLVQDPAVLAREVLEDYRVGAGA